MTLSILMEQFLNLKDLIPFFQTFIGAVLFVPIYAIWVTFLLPGLWVSMLAGALYGPIFGGIIVFFGATLGAEVSFILGRTFLRDWIRNRLEGFPKILAVQKAVSHEGLKLILLTRLSPAFPFSLLNFTYGLTDVSLKDFSIGLLGILPGTFFFTTLGALAGDITRFRDVLDGSADWKSWIIRFVGLLATIAVIWLVRRSVQKVLDKGD